MTDDSKSAPINPTADTRAPATPSSVSEAEPRVARWLIIGGGIAGAVLARALGDGAVVLDPAPGGYKIGESVSPEQFNNPLLAPLLSEVFALPSYSPKIGTTFVDVSAADGLTEIASFPLARHHTRTLHVMRDELERLLHARWQTPIERERVLHVDLATRTVTTDVGRWRSEGPILDCSGPAMVVASALDDVEQLWPVWAAWQYYDTTPDDSAFWRAAEHATVSFLDVPSCKIIHGATQADAAPTTTTLLTRIDNGLWMWQIPLYNKRILSVGVVSRDGPVSAEQQAAVLEKYGAACWQVADRSQVTDAEDIARLGVALPPETRVSHQRSGFARRARVAATEDYVLLGDAAAFADPVFSVGTSLAVSHALHVAAQLTRAPWTAELAALWSANASASFERAATAFQFWYDGSVLQDDDVAREVQNDYLSGRSFRHDALQAYATMIDEGNQQAAAVARADAYNLLPDPLKKTIIRTETNAAEHSVELRFPGGVVEVHRIAAEGKAWRVIAHSHGNLGVSYRGEQAPPELSVLAASVVHHADAWNDVLTTVAQMYV